MEGLEMITDTKDDVGDPAWMGGTRQIRRQPEIKSLNHGLRLSRFLGVGPHQGGSHPLAQQERRRTLSFPIPASPALRGKPTTLQVPSSSERQTRKPLSKA